MFLKFVSIKPYGHSALECFDSPDLTSKVPHKTRQWLIDKKRNDIATDTKRFVISWANAMKSRKKIHCSLCITLPNACNSIRPANLIL